MADRQQKRQWKNLLVDGRMQLRYALLVTGVSVVIAVTFGMLIYQQSTVASTQVITSLDGPGMEWLDASTKDAIRAQLGASDINLATTMFGVGIGLAIVLLSSLILTTHRVAGPLHRMANHFDEIHQGRLPAPGGLRRGDQFHEVFSCLQEAHESLRLRADADRKIIEAFMANVGVDASPDLKSALEELRQLRDEMTAVRDG